MVFKNSIEFQNVSWTCPGDSGSPIVKNFGTTVPDYRLIGILHGGPSSCISPPKTTPSLFANVEQEDNFKFIDKWKSMEDFFSTKKQSDSTLNSMKQFNPVDVNGQSLVDASRRDKNIRIAIVQRMCYDFHSTHNTRQWENHGLNCPGVIPEKNLIIPITTT